MTHYKINFAAQDDIQEIYNFGYGRFGEAQADRFLDAIYESFDVISASPYTFVSVDYIRPGYRRFVQRFGQNRTSIYYRITDSHIEIMRLIGWQNQDEI